MFAKYLFGLIASMGNFGLTGISGAATTYTTNALTLPFCINGKSFTKAQVAGGATPTTDAVTGSAITLVANQGTVVVWGLNAAGTVQVIKGSVETLDSSGAFTGAPAFPTLPDTFCPVAYHILKAGSTTVGTFTFGSSNWNSTGLTHTVVNVNVLPDRPQTS